MLTCSSTLLKQVVDAWKGQLIPETQNITNKKQNINGHLTCARPLFGIGIQSSRIRGWSGNFGLSICSRTTTTSNESSNDNLVHGALYSAASRQANFIVHTSWAFRSVFLTTRNVIEEKCKQIRCVIFARGRRYSADRNSNQFLPKRPRVRKSLCKSSLHGRREGKAWYIRECGLSASSQCCLQGQDFELQITVLREGGKGHLMVFPEILAY